MNWDICVDFCGGSYSETRGFTCNLKDNSEQSICAFLLGVLTSVHCALINAPSSALNHSWGAAKCVPAKNLPVHPMDMGPGLSFSQWLTRPHRGPTMQPCLSPQPLFLSLRLPPPFTHLPPNLDVSFTSAKTSLNPEHPPRPQPRPPEERG